MSEKQRTNNGTGFLNGAKANYGGLKPKDLCLIPFRVALAAQAAGWWVRSDIIWNKPNPMPESVTDRPTDAYEHIFMFTKSARYYWDQEAVREPHLTEPGPLRDFAHEGYNEAYMSTRGAGLRTGYNDNGRNLRNVWTFPTQPYKGAHFATFPEALPEKCIKAATPEYGCCDKCGMPYERVVERVSTGKSYAVDKSKDKRAAGLATAFSGYDDGSSCPSFKTLGWQQACKCGNSKPAPSKVLDPFAGSGTTLYVARKLGRYAVGYELSATYCRLIEKRNEQGVL
jgi:DNA modification methylase